MKICVYGAGAVGGHIAGRLAAGQTEVSVIERGEQLDAIREYGLRVETRERELVSHPFVTDRPGDLESQDVVIVAVKAPILPRIAEGVGSLLHQDSLVLVVGNGIPWWYFHGLPGRYEGWRVESVDPGGAVSAVIAPERAIGCVVYSSTEIERPGVIRHVEGTRFSIGEPDGTISARCTAFSEAMVAGGLKCPVEPDLRADIWIKLMGNVALNPLSVLTGATLAELCTHPSTRELVAGIMREALDVAAALGTTPAIDIERRLEGARRVGDHKTSMLQDYEAGKPLELAAITTAVVELAELTRTPVPRLEAIHAAVELLMARGPASSP
jgi:2-dehydropantoate 2-reductase